MKEPTEFAKKAMKILLDIDAVRFTYQRINSVILDYQRADPVILHAGLRTRDYGRLVEARDQLAAALAEAMGPAEAQVFLETPDGYRAGEVLGDSP
jgi:hypothetical protein